MNIYRVVIEYQGYDTNDGHVIVASSKAEAIRLASEAAADEGNEIWFNHSDIILLGKAANVFKFPEILLTSFRAG